MQSHEYKSGRQCVVKFPPTYILMEEYVIKTREKLHVHLIKIFESIYSEFVPTHYLLKYD